MKKPLLTLSIFLLFFAGIIRHDVEESLYLELAKQKQFECVGQLMSDTTPRGTCVLINEKYIVTAAHCLTESDVRKDSLVINNITYTTYTDYNFRVSKPNSLICKFGEIRAKVKRIIIHPQYNDSTTKGDSYDIAILELENEILNIQLPILNTELDEKGSNVVGVGFGVSGPANKPELVLPLNKKIAGENIIDQYLGEKINGEKVKMVFDFDHPIEKKYNTLGKSIAMPLEYGTGGGDSGGGLFKFKNGKWQLVGCCPIGEGGIKMKKLLKHGYYGSKTSWLRIAVFNQWINQIIIH